MPKDKEKPNKQLPKRVDGERAVKIKINEDGEREYALNSDSAFLSTGTSDTDLATTTVTHFLHAIPKTGHESTDLRNTNASLAIMRGIEPKDEVEGMLAAQIVATHNIAMEMASRALIRDQSIDGVDRNVNRLTKLTRSFTNQLEALNKYRGKGQQKMTVEHVHVNEGGQAIIGEVNNESRGG